jgi:hypothetical protein
MEDKTIAKEGLIEQAVSKMTKWMKYQLVKSAETSQRVIEWDRTHFETRQLRRQRQRHEAFVDMSQRFPGEDRKVRWSMAFDLLKLQRKSSQ